MSMQQEHERTTAMFDRAALEELADGILNQAGAGEQIELMISRSTETEIRSYEGAVENLSVASGESLGVRVIVDGRQGYASTNHNQGHSKDLYVRHFRHPLSR